MILEAIVTILFGLLVSIFVHILSKQISKFHTLRSLLIHYVINSVMNFYGAKAKRLLDQDAKNFSQTQEKLLLHILNKNSETNYGKKFNFASLKSRDDFVQNHPITRYKHFKEFIDEIAKGGKNILTQEQPWMLAVTSGTTGQSCLIPKTRDNSRAFFKFGFAVGMYHTIFSSLPQSNNLQKSLKLFHAPRTLASEGGIPIGASSSAPSLQLNALSTPRAHFNITSEPVGLYIHMLFALRDRDLGSIMANFAYWIHGIFVFLENNWRSMVRDLEKGEMNPELELTDHVRSELNKLLQPDKKRAEELRQEFEKGFDGIARRIWPCLTHVHGVTTGSSELYATMLRESYLKGVPLLSTIYGASEGLIGVNIWPLEPRPSYLLVPRSMFFEFIPIQHADEKQTKTVFGEDVRIGSLYELVVTTLSGLYRYRIGDVVKVVRFHHNCPVVEFQYRQGQLLNMRSEKTTEVMMYEALTTVFRRTAYDSVQLVDYTCAESILFDFATEGSAALLNSTTGKELTTSHKTDYSRTKPFYVVFLEISSLQLNGAEREKLSEELDHALCEVNPCYRLRREHGGFVDPLKVCFVHPGTFQKFRKFLLQVTPTAVNQLKIPRKLKSEEQLMFFLKNLPLNERTLI